MTTLEASARPRRGQLKGFPSWCQKMFWHDEDRDYSRQLTSPFVAKEYFVQGYGVTRRTRWGVTAVHRQFAEYFTDGDGLVERYSGLEVGIGVVSVLTKPGNARNILDWVCSIGESPTSLLRSVYSFVFPKMEPLGALGKHRRGVDTKYGMPLKDLAFVVDQRGECRLVSMSRYRGGVAFDAFPINSDGIFWPAGTRVLLSRYSAPTGVL